MRWVALLVFVGLLFVSLVPFLAPAGASHTACHDVSEERMVGPWDQVTGGSRFMQQVVVDEHFRRTHDFGATGDERPGDSWSSNATLRTEQEDSDWRHLDVEQVLQDLGACNIVLDEGKSLCLCDVELFLDEDLPTKWSGLRIEIMNVAAIIVNNVTIHGGILAIRGVGDVVIVNNTFHATSIYVFEQSRDVLVHRNSFLGRAGPLEVTSNRDVVMDIVRPPTYPLRHIYAGECAPHHRYTCAPSELYVQDAQRAFVTNNHFDHGVLATSDNAETKILHNDFFNLRYSNHRHGTVELGWNLFRGQERSTTQVVVANGHIHNNSWFIWPEHYYYDVSRDTITLHSCSPCVVENNDFLFGYGYFPVVLDPLGYEYRMQAAVVVTRGEALLDHNYWGIMGDPRSSGAAYAQYGGSYALTYWSDEPFHPIDQIYLPLHLREGNANAVGAGMASLNVVDSYLSQLRGAVSCSIWPDEPCETVNGQICDGLFDCTISASEYRALLRLLLPYR